jgi:phytoene dehydrogenase-like protein
MNRRHILKAGAVIGTTSVTGLSLWRLGQARSHDYDVAVVGAGVTGLAATEALKKKGLSVELLEASDRRGGRVVTDNATFGVPDDIGAHWFHGRNSNALYDYTTIRLTTYDYATMRLCDYATMRCRQADCSTYKASDNAIVYVGGSEARSSECDAFEHQLAGAEEAMSNAASLGQAVTAASVSPMPVIGRTRLIFVLDRLKLANT